MPASDHTDSPASPQPAPRPQDLGAIYRDLEAELSAIAPECRACGRCCRFEEAGHVLFVSRIEIDYLLANAPPVSSEELVLAGERNACPFYSDGRCGAREGRALGCRVFFCASAWADRGNEIYEQYVRRIADLSDRCGLPWDYSPLPRALAARAAGARDNGVSEDE